MLERLAPRRWWSRRWVDLGLASALVALALVNLLTDPQLPHTALAVLVVILIGLPVAWRRSHPVGAAVAVVAVLLAGAALQRGKFVPDTESLVAFVLAYSCGARASLHYGLLAVGALLVAMQVSVGFSEFPNIEIAITVLPPLWVGRQVRRRRDLVTALAARTHELEIEQDAFVRLSVRRERARIARELHDIVAHQLTVIAVQAAAGRMASSEDRAAERFETVRQSAGQALAEMARLVHVLQADRPGPDDGRRRLRVLLEQAQAGGLDVHATPLAPDVQLRAGVEDTAFRVVQEGLTNAMKHAPGAEVHVRFALHADWLDVDVLDSGGVGRSVLARTGSGLGLTGMRERVESLGGSVDAGPDAGGGWLLHARWPTAVASRG
jgi:signal transduction histidine kinase